MRFICLLTLNILTKAVGLKFYDANFNASKSAKVTNAIISIDMRIESNLVVGFNNDRVSANLLATQTLKALFSNAFMGSCASHTSCHSGDSGTRGQHASPVLARCGQRGVVRGIVPVMLGTF